MRCSYLNLVVAAFFTPTAFLLAEDNEIREAMTPEVAEASSEGEEAMQVIRFPEGWEIELFAAEPNVANVVAFDIDHAGRIYVAETYRQNRGVTDNRGHDEKWLLADLAAETVQDRIDYHRELLGDAVVTYEQYDDRVRRLEDTNGDGKADSSVVVANGFNHLEEGTGAGVLWRPTGLYYTCIPKLWKLIDSNEDGVVDERIVLSDGFGVRVAFRGHDLHGLIVGPDGRLYFSIGDRGYHVTTQEGVVLANPDSGAVFRCELDGSGLEVFCSGLRNPQELAFNDLGDFFTVDNNSDSGDQARVVHLLQDGDSGWRMYYQYLPDRGPFNRESIWKLHHAEQPAYIVPPIANFTDGPSGLAYYPGTGFGPKFKDTFFICDFRGGAANSGVRTFHLEPKGATYQFGANDNPIWTVLATDIAFGPDGSLYVSDWVNGWDGLGKGRIYRFRDPVFSNSDLVKDVQSRLALNWDEVEEANLEESLSHQDRRIRLEAQWELAERGLWERLVGVATKQENEQAARLHALWGIDQIARKNPLLEKSILEGSRELLTDPDSVIRAAAIKFAGERKDQLAASLIRKSLQDESSRVRYFALRAVGDLRDSAAVQEVQRIIIQESSSDPAIRHASIHALAKIQTPEQLRLLVSHPSEDLRRSAVVALRHLQSSVVADFLEDSSELVALDAARAIYDLPIPEAMQKLSESTNLHNANVEFVRRALNANHRAGSKLAAQRVAEVAARPTVSNEMRLEALRIMEHWNPSDSRDRVLNDYRPIEVRPSIDAAEALEPKLPALMIADDEIRDEAIRVASQLRIKGIAPMLAGRVKDENLTSSERANALTALARLDADTAVVIALDIRLIPADEVVLSALEVLAEYAPVQSVDRLIEATESRDSRVRQIAWDLIAPMKDEKIQQAINLGMERYLAGDIPADVALNLVEASNGRLSGEMVAKLKAYEDNLIATDPLGPWLLALEGGEIEAGRKLFFEDSRLSCLRCHQVGRSGGQVGPNLTMIGVAKERRYLLESICLPDASVAEGFETAVILTVEGNTIAGIIKSETTEIIDLIKPDGSLVQLKVDEIEARRKGKSSMPEDLIQKLSLRQLRDLVAYLESLKVDSRNAGDVE
jgi:quinoprotein glucose dehydrogenase